MSYYTCGRTDALALTHLTVTAHWGKSTRSDTNLLNVISPFMTIPRHTLQICLHNICVNVNFIPTIYSKKNVLTYILLSTHIPFFATHFRHSKFLHFPSLSLNPACANSFLSSTFQQIYSRTNEFLYDRVNGNYHNNTHSCLEIQALFREQTLLYQQNITSSHIENSFLTNFPFFTHHLMSNLSTS